MGARALLPLRTPALAVAAVTLVFVLLGLLFASFMSFGAERNLVDQTMAEKGEIGHSLRLLVDAETGQRGFLLTGDDSYLEPYELARRELPGVTRNLMVLMRDDAAQRARLVELDRLSQAKLDELGRTVELSRENAKDRALAIVKSDQGKRVMDQIRHLEAAMESSEDQRLAQRTISASRFGGLSLVLTGLASCLLAFVGYLLHLVGRQVGGELARRELAELRAADLENFAGRVAHDVRSPLATVTLAIEVAKRHPGIDPRGEVALDRATRTLLRVGELVDGLLVFSSAGGLPAEDARADVRDTVSEVVEEMRAAAQDKQVDLKLEELCTTVVRCSVGVLTSMVSNLVGNAIKYMDEAPVKYVGVRARDQGATTRIEVLDTGPGVPRELWGRVFDPYIRAATSKIPGLGLGLATVRRLAEAHGGAVGIAKNEGAGSLFWLELPSVPGGRADQVPAMAPT